MRFTDRANVHELRRDALVVSARRGRVVSKLRIWYRTMAWLIWSWFLPVLGIVALLVHLVWIPYFQPISTAIELAAQPQLVITGQQPSAPTLTLLPPPLPSIDAVALPLILDFCISKPNIQDLDFCISKPSTQEKP